MKLITSLDEYLNAGILEQLEYFDGEEWVFASNWDTENFLDVYSDLKQGSYRWKPEEITLVECKTDNENYPVVFIPQSDISGYETVTFIGLQADKTKRTVTGVVSDE